MFLFDSPNMQLNEVFLHMQLAPKLSLTILSISGHLEQHYLKSWIQNCFDFSSIVFRPYIPTQNCSMKQCNAQGIHLFPEPYCWLLVVCYEENENQLNLHKTLRLQTDFSDGSNAGNQNLNSFLEHFYRNDKFAQEKTSQKLSLKLRQASSRWIVHLSCSKSSYFGAIQCVDGSNTQSQVELLWFQPRIDLFSMLPGLLSMKTRSEV